MTTIARKLKKTISDEEQLDERKEKIVLAAYEFIMSFKNYNRKSPSDPYWLADKFTDAQASEFFQLINAMGEHIDFED